MADYGVLKDVVAGAGSLMAAALAIRLGWMRRAKWMPPGESVPDATIKLASLGCAVVIGILFLLRFDLGPRLIASMSAISFLLALVALGMSIYTNIVFSFIRYLHKDMPDGKRVLGGYHLTAEAKGISVSKSLGPQQLFENANYESDLVWTRRSQAMTAIVSTFGFIILQLSGSVALAAISMAISMKI